MHRVDYEAGMAFYGNTGRIQKVLKKAEAGEKVTLAYLGGSITQGSLSSTPETCYAAMTTKWWREQYPQTEFVYINAGIGGTPSQFGVARVEEDVLSYEPDFVVVEFSVNDDNSLFYRETYEGLVRKIYSSKTNPAVLLVHNVFYQTGTNAQDQHEVIGRYYGIPCVSMKTSVYQAVAEGKIPAREITPDDLHPNDAGHAMLSRLITYYLEKVQNEADTAVAAGGFTTKREAEMLPKPITANAYEHSVRYQNHTCKPELYGFVADEAEQRHITDVFKRGFVGAKTGDTIRFAVSGSGIAVQYRKSVKHPACIAKAVLDGDEEHAVTLDGNFEETWGDCLYITTILSHGEEKEHTLEITITDGGEEKVPFYLVAVIGNK